MATERRPTAAGTIVEALFAHASAAPRQLAYAVGEQRVTYGTLLADVQRLAASLAARGVTRGSRCALVLPTSLDFIRTIFAVQLLGAVPVALNPAVAADVTARRLCRLKVDLAIAGRDATPVLRRAIGEPSAHRLEAVEDLSAGAAPAAVVTSLPRPDAPAFLQLTAGTTGEPRAVIVTHRSLMASLTASGRRLTLAPGDVLATWIPLHHDLGLVRFVFGALYFRCPCHLVLPSITNLRQWLQTIDRVRATVTASPDFGYRLAARLVDPTALDLGSLRVATNGGEPVRWSTIEAFETRFGVPGVVRPGYGLAEATLGVAGVAPGEPLVVDAHGTVSCGRPFDGVRLRIVDSANRDMPPGIHGEILVQGDVVFAGYLDDDAASSAALEDGWLHTGDVGTLDREGRLFVKGRARALIKRGGAAIAPREIEEIVDRLEGVRLSAAIGIPAESEDGTESVVVVAEVRPDAAAAASDHLALAGRIADVVSAAIPASVGRVLLVAPRTIPRTPSGKIRYDELRCTVACGRIGPSVLFSA